MYLKKLIKNLVNEEEGNSLVEFAMVLPMLIVLTIGGIYLSVSFGQKSILDGVNFMQARAGSVRKNPENAAQKAKERYLNAAKGQKWIEKTETINADSPGVSSNGMQDFRIGLAKDAMQLDILANSLGMLSGKKPEHKLRKLTSFMTLPVEYVTHKTANSGYVSDRSKTWSIVDYDAKTGIEDAVGSMLNILPEDSKAMIESKIFKKLIDPKHKTGMSDSDQGDAVMGTNPDLNMDKVKDFYDNWGLDFKYNGGAGNTWKASEEPLTKIDPDSLYFLKSTAKYAHTIKNGTVALQVIVPELAVFLNTPPASTVIGPIKGAVGAIEKIGKNLGEGAELNNQAIFVKTSLGRQ